MNASVTAQRRLISLAEYHRMGEARIFTGDDRVELIEGEMIQMSPIGARHFARVNRLQRVLAKAVGDLAIVSVQGPVALPPQSEPMPDVALLKPKADDYASGLPGPRDVLLVIEVSDSTLAYDRDAKMPVYARHGIPEAWIVDVNAQTLTVFLDPGEAGYRTVASPAAGTTIVLSQLPSVSVRLDELLG